MYFKAMCIQQVWQFPRENVFARILGAGPFCGKFFSVSCRSDFKQQWTNARVVCRKLKILEIVVNVHVTLSNCQENWLQVFWATMLVTWNFLGQFSATREI